MHRVNLSYWFKTSYQHLRAECLSLEDGVLLPFFYFGKREKSSKGDNFYLNFRFWRYLFLTSSVRSFGLFIGIYKMSMKSYFNVGLIK